MEILVFNILIGTKGYYSSGVVENSEELKKLITDWWLGLGGCDEIWQWVVTYFDKFFVNRFGLTEGNVGKA